MLDYVTLTEIFQISDRKKKKDMDPILRNETIQTYHKKGYICECDTGNYNQKIIPLEVGPCLVHHEPKYIQIDADHIFVYRHKKLEY